jgi:YD repeat-containing protein
VPDSSSNPSAGNPIYPLTGVKTQPISTGMRVGGIALRLTFDSSSKVPGAVSSLYAQQPSFGGIWFSSLHRRLVVSISKKTATLSRGDGHIIGFTGNGTGTFTTLNNRLGKLVTISGGYRFEDSARASQEIYNTQGQLTSLTTARGRVLTFTYDANRNLTKVQDDTGRFIQFDYAAAVVGSPLLLVSRITDTRGLAIVPSYDSKGNLSALVWPDSKTRQFLYENTSFPWALTGVMDENNSRYSTFTYDSAGRAISTEHAGGVDRFSVAYGQPPSQTVVDTYNAGTNTVTRTRRWNLPSDPVLTTPNGSTTNLGLQSRFGVPALTSRSQPAGSGCPASTSATAYDSNGNVISKDDFTGHRTCYAYDANNNVNLTVEGLSTNADCAATISNIGSPPAGARVTKTLWDTSRPRAVQVTGPSAVSTIVYLGNTDPDTGSLASCSSAPSLPSGQPLSLVCKQGVRATLANGSIDPSVPAHVSSYTYDANGRVLTAKDSLNRTTTYAYYATTAFTGVDPNAVGYSIGDLQTITDPKGFVTTFNSYDKSGRVLQMTDPKGIVTAMTYTPRGWVKTVTVTPPGGPARLTTYSYDNVGQLTGVQNPDGTSISYTYDAAHRLVGATDARGNSVTYTLDNVGNRIAEQLKDPGGVLQRSMSRSFDALNRVQQLQVQ